MTAAIQRVRVVLPLAARSTESTAPLPPLPVPVSHWKTVRQLADPINTVTVAELRWREDAHPWRCPRVATWVKTAVVLALLLAALVAVFAWGVQRAQLEGGAGPVVPPQPATTVAVPTTLGGASS